MFDTAKSGPALGSSTVGEGPSHFQVPGYCLVLLIIISNFRTVDQNDRIVTSGQHAKKDNSV